MAKNVTMRDIAEKVGVSTVTVSKALTDKEGVGAELRNIIRKTAEEIGYHYSAGDTGFRKGRSYNIGVIVEDHFIDGDEIALPFYMKMYHNINRQLSQFQYSVIMEAITADMLKYKRKPNIIAEHKVDGVIVLGYINTEYLQIVRESGIPVVYLDFYDAEMKVPSVISDNVYGSYMITNYLISKGHRKMAYVGSIEATPSILDRYLGYYRALLNNNILLRQDYILPDRDKNGYNIEIKLPEDMPTAFVCNCDEVANSLIEQLMKKGYRIPEDISVVGFDNYSLSTFVKPKLTTVEVDIDEMTQTAVEMLIRQLKGEENVGGRKVICGKLIVRDSVKDLNKK